jgi:hypothetical protein
MVRMVTVIVVLVTAASTKLAVAVHILTHISLSDTTAHHWTSRYTVHNLCIPQTFLLGKS